MSSFVSTKQHVEVCKRLEKKIESLIRDKSHLEDTCNAEQERGDEWKRRARDLYYCKTPPDEAKSWFEDE